MSRKNKSVVKDWSEDKDKCPPTSDLLAPLRKIVFEGYELERKNIVNFNYTGYGIGETYLLSEPTPDERFSARWLNNDDKFDRYLIDNILLVAFQLGTENGRRIERQNKIPYNVLEKMFEIRGEKINSLISRLLEYGEDLSTSAEVSLSTDEDLQIPQASDIVEP